LSRSASWSGAIIKNDLGATRLNFYSTPPELDLRLSRLHPCITPFRNSSSFPDLIRFAVMLGFSLFLRLPATFSPISGRTRPRSFRHVEGIRQAPFITVGFSVSFY